MDGVRAGGGEKTGEAGVTKETIRDWMASGVQAAALDPVVTI